MLDEVEEIYYKFKVILIGESGTGKTSIISRYVNKAFNQGQTTTLFNDFCIKKQQYLGENINLYLWDTTGQQRFRSITKLHFQGSDIVIFVFSLTQEKTFTQLINYWIPETKKKTQNPRFFLYGSKADLVENLQDKNNQLQNKIQKLKQQHQCYYFYGSAKNFEDKGIQQMMNKIVETLYERIPKSDLKASRLKELQEKQKSRIERRSGSVKIKSSIIDEPPQKKKRCYFF